jgi:Icc-related predicted phosphoesterase
MLVMAHLNGRLDMLEQVLERGEEVDLALFAGSALGDGDDAPRTYADLYSHLERLGIPTYCIPGEADAPERCYMAAAIGHESVGRHVSTVHSLQAETRRGEYVVVGFGGRITDDERDHERHLRYPGWELLWRLRLLSRIDPLPVLLLHHPPAGVQVIDRDAAGASMGHPAVTEAIATWHPRVAVCAGVRPGHEWVGDTLVASPGRLDCGEYAVVDLRDRTVRHEQISQAAAV